MRLFSDNNVKDFAMDALKQIGFDFLEGVDLLKDPLKEDNRKLVINCIGSKQCWVVNVRPSLKETVQNKLSPNEAAFSISGALIEYADGKRHALDSFSYIFICNEHDEAVFVKSVTSRIHEQMNRYNGWVIGGYK
jgi:hypothetical protein